MGGVAGHMNHLYDNPDLTFTQMKEIIIAAGDGKLEGTEKTDGQNLFITYDIQTRTARAARNKGNLRSGGLDAAGLAAKFAGRGSVEAAFNDAFSIFEQAIESLSAKEIKRVFQPLGPRYQVYYNSEIQDPRNANVINYDTKTLNVHRVGHIKYDRREDEVTPIDLSKESKFIETVLSRMQRAVANQDFRIQMNAIRNLKELDNKEPVRVALAALEKTIDDAGISDQNTVGEYLIARIVPVIQSYVQLPPDKEVMVLKRILSIPDPETKKNYRIIDIKKGLEPRQQQKAIELVKSAGKIIGDAIRPLEDIVHDFSVEMLRSFESIFILDDEAEVSRLRAEVDHAIKSIEASGSDEAMTILQKHMKKLKSLDNVTTASEGFVFDYDGVTYKFTGNFAPINQILGLFKYGRKGISIEPLEEAEEPQGEEEAGKLTSEPVNKIVGVFPGAFKPPHRGHLDVVKHLARFANKVIVMISPLSRKSKSGMEFTADQSLKVWELYLQSAGLSNAIAIVSQSNSPVRQAIDFVANEDDDPALAKPGDTVILGCSTKPDKRGQPDCARFNSVDQYAKDGVEVANPMKPQYKDFAFEPKPPALSASDFREIVATNPDDMMPYLPEGVSPDQILSIFQPSGKLGNMPISLEESQKKTITLSPDLLFSLVEEQLELFLTEASEETADAYSKMSDTEKDLADVEKSSSEADESVAAAKEKAAKAAETAAKVNNQRKKMLDLRQKGLEQMQAAEEAGSKAEETAARAIDAKKKAAEASSKADEEAAKAAEAKAKAAEVSAKADEEVGEAAETKQKAAEVAAKADEELAKAAEERSKAAEEKSKALDAAKKASEEAAKLQDPAAKAEEEKQKSYEELEKAYDEAAKASEESSGAHSEREKALADTSDALGDAAKEEEEAEEEQEERDREQEEKDKEREEADKEAQKRSEEEAESREADREAREADKEAEEEAGEALEEISGMAAGAVEGAPGKKKKKKREIDTLIREDDDEIIEEVLNMVMGV